MSFDVLAWLVIAFWIGFRVALIVVRPKIALGVGLVVAICSLVLPSIMPLMVAILAPFSFLLPALALRDVFGSFRSFYCGLYRNVSRRSLPDGLWTTCSSSRILGRHPLGALAAALLHFGCTPSCSNHMEFWVFELQFF